jgi:hypothetical protein
MTSIVGITALQELRKFKGFENAVIAGGFVRDSIMGGPFKDLDIFIPVSSAVDFREKVSQNFKIETPGVPGIDENVNAARVEDWITKHIQEGQTRASTVKRFNFALSFDHASYHVTEKNAKPAVYGKDIGNFKDFIYTKNGYKEVSPFFMGRYDCKYMDFLDVDICGFKYTSQTKFDGSEDTEGFPQALINDFSFNLDKVYYDGETTVQSKEFQRDIKYNEATLSKLGSMQGLPHAMRKFERLREKYPHLAFRTTVLSLKEEENSHKKPIPEYINKYVSATTGADRPWLAPEDWPGALPNPAAG